jgi:putative N6-adenine-specific DNA methylase
MLPPTPQLFAICPPGLESILQDEVQALGIRGTAVEGGVAWEGRPLDLISSHLHLRTATRILVRIHAFRARALGELERKAGALPWHTLIPPDPPVQIRVSAGLSRIYHERAAEERLTRVLEAAGFRVGSEAEAPAEGASTGLWVRIFRDEVTFSLDATGRPLHLRGYRLDPGAAPLRETLAAGALLSLARIPRGWNPTLPFLDPFAGSGTLAIEAALLALRIPPALALAPSGAGMPREPRDFAFLNWPGAPLEAFRAAVVEAQERILPAPPAELSASDRDAGTVDRMRENAARAGVLSQLHVSQAPLSRAELPPAGGWVVTNPPYGARLGERRSLRPLYRSLGDRIRSTGGRVGLGLFAADPVLSQETGLDLDELFTTRTGGIRARFLAAPPRDLPPPPPPPVDP